MNEKGKMIDGAMSLFVATVLIYVVMAWLQFLFAPTYKPMSEMVDEGVVTYYHSASDNKTTVMKFEHGRYYILRKRALFVAKIIGQPAYLNPKPGIFYELWRSKEGFYYFIEN